MWLYDTRKYTWGVGMLRHCTRMCSEATCVYGWGWVGPVSYLTKQNNRRNHAHRHRLRILYQTQENEHLNI